MTTRGLIYRSFGEPKQTLEVFEAERRELRPGEVEIGICLAPINPSDLIAIKGAYPNHTRVPSVAGYEGMGRILRVAPDTGLQVGARVIPIATAGTWQSHLILDAAHAIRVPDSLSDEVAAMAYINPLSALLMLNTIDVTGKTVLLTAGGSNCARLLGQWALRDGADRVLAVTDTSIHDRSLSALGVVPVRPEQALGAIDRDVVCFDAVGGRLAENLLQAMPPDSEFLAYGLLSGEGIRRMPKTVRFNLFHLRNWIHSATHEDIVETFEEVFRRLQTAMLPGTAEYDWTDWRKAMEHFSIRGREKKPMLRFSHD